MHAYVVHHIIRHFYLRQNTFVLQVMWITRQVCVTTLRRYVKFLPSETIRDPSNKIFLFHLHADFICVSLIDYKFPPVVRKISLDRIQIPFFF